MTRRRQRGAAAPRFLARLRGHERRGSHAAGRKRPDLVGRDLAPIRREADRRSRLLAVIADPNVAYVLMLIGIYGLFFEFANPGYILPGVAGAISLVLALYAFQILPVNYAGLALLCLGIIFMLGEVFVPSFGALGIGMAQTDGQQHMRGSQGPGSAGRPGRNGKIVIIEHQNHAFAFDIFNGYGD